ncbi:MAG: L,D-transpeptidase [Candidatus Sericytochromatia bacterium]
MTRVRSVSARSLWLAGLLCLSGAWSVQAADLEPFTPVSSAAAALPLPDLHPALPVPQLADAEIPPAPGGGIALRAHLSPHQVLGTHLYPVLISGPTGQLRVLLNGQSVHSAMLQANTPLLLPAVPLKPGQHRLELELQTPAGVQRTPPQLFYSFGVEPPDHSYLLVDKYNFTLYEVHDNVLTHVFPIATGRPSLPTLPGLWLIGGKENMPPASDWGARRMKIYRENQYLTHWSGYAIHGTNRPTSIGTEASHGCVRMFNHDVTSLFARTAVGTPVLIVERLKVYVDKVGAPASTDEDSE